MKNKKIIYTDSAKERLNQLFSELELDIEKYIRSTKFVPGDDFIEVTAADINRIADNIIIKKPNKSNNIKYFILIIYTISGFTLTLYGLFYEEFINLLIYNPIQIIYITLGVFMSLIGFYFYYRLIKREKASKIFYDENRTNKILNEILIKESINKLHIGKYVTISNDKSKLYQIFKINENEAQLIDDEGKIVLSPLNLINLVNYDELLKKQKNDII